MDRPAQKKKRSTQENLWLPFHYLTYLGYRIFEWKLRLLPLSVCRGIGEFVGGLFHWVAPGYRRLVRRNLRIALTDEKTEHEIRALTRQHFVAMGGNFLASMKIALMPTAAVEALCTYENREFMEEAVAQGKGVIGALAHFGTWEIMSQIPSMGGGVKPATLYRPLTNPFLEAHVRKRRANKGCALFDRTGGFYAPLQHIREGGGLGVLIDQHAGDRGIWCPFFGRLSSTSNLAALLSVKTGAPVVTITILPDPAKKGHFIVAYQPPVTPPELEKNEAIQQMTAQLNTNLEQQIRRAPEQWFWLHERWKTPAPKFLLADYRRGIHIPDETKLKPFRLVVRSPNPLGDACMAIPAIRAIKRGRPDLQLTILCRENVAPIWQQVDAVDQVVGVPRSMKPREVGRHLSENHGYFDVALLFPNSLSSALEINAASVGRVIGFRGHWRRLLLDQVLEKKFVPGPPRHHAYSYLDVAEAIGADVSDPDLFETSQPEPASELRIGICPGAEYGEAKRWPVDRYAAAARDIYAQTGAELRIFGSPNETNIGEQLEAQLGEVPCQNRVGKTSVTELIEELKTCHLLVTNDTGTMHLAGILGVPTVSIFGSTEPRWTSAIGTNHTILRKHVECTPCFLRECPLDFRCMKAIEVDEVVTAAVEAVG